MRSFAGLALTTSALFLVLVAVLLNSNALFYMSTAIIATIGASRLQAWLSVRGLRFDRRVPERAHTGETVAVDISVWSDRRIRRPLVVLRDNLPQRMLIADRTPSLPVAPAFDIPVVTQYHFKPMRRGRYRWSSVTVVGTDALGLVSMMKTYTLPSVDLLVLPTPLPIDIEIPGAAGWGAADSQEGQARGAGIEPRGIREYVQGDSMRYVHWRSSARSGTLLVKEFDTGSFATIAIMLQRTEGTVVGEGANTSFEQMVSHAAHLAERFLRQGAEVSLPGIEQEEGLARTALERSAEVLDALAGVEADSKHAVSDDLIEQSRRLPTGTLVYLLLVAADPALPAAVNRARAAGMRVACLLYNPDSFPQRKRGPQVSPATDVGYADALASAGAEIVFVPRQEAFE